MIVDHSEAEVKETKKLSYIPLNGNMYALITKNGNLGLKLSKTEFDGIIMKFNTQILKNYGADLRRYVEVSEDILEDAEILKPNLELSYEYAKMLKPKPTKKF